MTSYTLALSGSSIRTVMCAQTLLLDPRFTISSIITPSPRPIGRKATLTPNPLHQFALDHSIPLTLVENKIDDTFHNSLLAHTTPPSFLLVIDFGYLIPRWLLDWPQIAPINIHPSDLPKYRGSSPAQFALLFGQTQSAVTLIKMDALLDHGPIIKKLPFDIDPSWTAADYYHSAFSQVSPLLPDILATYSEDKLVPQPDLSPTPIARQLTRDDGFFDIKTHNSTLLNSLNLINSPKNFYNLYRALTPWPGIWTIITTKEGVKKRLKILEASLTLDRFEFVTVQLEGKTPQPASTLQLDTSQPLLF